jgi:hypothetical protein
MFRARVRRLQVNRKRLLLLVIWWIRNLRFYLQILYNHDQKCITICHVRYDGRRRVRAVGVH